MYKLIRRISSSFFPRPDRPWSEDATSTAPQIGRKRRLSSTEPDERETTPAKRHRAESEEQEQTQESTQPTQDLDTKEVKEVTRGVRDVELEEGQEKPPAEEQSETSAEAEMAAAVPLPDSPELKADAGEKDDVDAEGEEDVVESKEDSVVPVEETPSATEEKPSAPTAVAAEQEIPGLTLSSDTPSNFFPAPVVTTTTETAVAAA